MYHCSPSLSLLTLNSFHSVSLKHPSKGMVSFQGFYQNKKNDAEASAAQHVIRDWDIQLLQSHEISGISTPGPLPQESKDKSHFPVLYMSYRKELGNILFMLPARLNECVPSDTASAAVLSCFQHIAVPRGNIASET